LKTVPVGAPGTVIFCGPAKLPSPSKIDDVPLALLATHHGLLGPAEMPHAFAQIGILVRGFVLLVSTREW
jgi:hypothetical protein